MGLKPLKPKKKYTNVICDVCDLPWDDHLPDDDGKIDVSECVRLLKARVPKPVPYYYPYVIGGGGWRCNTCGAWVYGSHACYYYTPTISTVGTSYASGTNYISGTTYPVNGRIDDDPDSGVPAVI